MTSVGKITGCKPWTVEIIFYQIVRRQLSQFASDGITLHRMTFAMNIRRDLLSLVSCFCVGQDIRKPSYWHFWSLFICESDFVWCLSETRNSAAMMTLLCEGVFEMLWQLLRISPGLLKLFSWCVVAVISVCQISGYCQLVNSLICSVVRRFLFFICTWHSYYLTQLLPNT